MSRSDNRGLFFRSTFLSCRRDRLITCMCVRSGLHACVCASLSDIFTALCLHGSTWVWLGNVIQISCIPIKIKYLCYSLQGETRGCNREHMWSVTVCRTRAHCRAIRPSTKSAHKHTHTPLHIYTVCVFYSYEARAWCLALVSTSELRDICWWYFFTLCKWEPAMSLAARIPWMFAIIYWLFDRGNIYFPSFLGPKFPQLNRGCCGYTVRGFTTRPPGRPPHAVNSWHQIELKLTFICGPC